VGDGEDQQAPEKGGKDRGQEECLGGVEGGVPAQREMRPSAGRDQLSFENGRLVLLDEAAQVAELAHVHSFMTFKWRFSSKLMPLDFQIAIENILL
jgi:hypothetical protein